MVTAGTITSKWQTEDFLSLKLPFLYLKQNGAHTKVSDFYMRLYESLICRLSYMADQGPNSWRISGTRVTHTLQQDTISSGPMQALFTRGIPFEDVLGKLKFGRSGGHIFLTGCHLE